MFRMFSKRKKMVGFWTLVLSILMLMSSSGIAAAGERTYTLDADFNEGVLVGVEHDSVHDQLQLSKTNVTLPFIWVPNLNNTVSKVNTVTGKEIGRYNICPPGVWGSPSRTTVDLQGNCYVGNRSCGTVVKIGLFEAGQWTDRNGNGVCDTSVDLDNDGSVTGAEVLPWGQDECVLYEAVVIPGSEGVCEPGENTAYANDYWNPGPRSLAVDAYNNLWVGCYGSQKFYYLNGSTGVIQQTIDVSPWGHTPYGATIDKNGAVWSSSLNNHVLKIDPSTTPAAVSVVELGTTAYGIGLDYLGHLFVAYNALSKLDINTGGLEWSAYKPEIGFARGVACTGDNDVWVVDSGNGNLLRYDNEGSLKATIPVGSAPTGVSVDAVGKVWVCNLGDENIHRIDPSTNTIDLTKQLIGSSGHYSYSDMTGMVARTISTKIGTWTAAYDSGSTNSVWDKVCWNSSEPTGTSVKVRVRSSNDNSIWSAWEYASNGAALSATPDARYLQVEATLQIMSGEVSPILYDMTVITKETNVLKGRMTGGGSVFTKEGQRVTHGFTLNSDIKESNNLQINWGKGNKFHLESLSQAVLSDDPNLNPDRPTALFDTFKGSGSGRFNGIPGATIEFLFTDAGEPGKNDTAKILIKDKDGTIVLEASGKLNNGNHQAHNL